MADESQTDIDAEVLEMIAADGHDMSAPMDVELHVALPTEEAANEVAAVAQQMGYETEVSFDDGSDDPDIEEEITEPWTCTCIKAMVLDHAAIVGAQKDLDEVARRLGGYSDGWGTFGNTEVEDEEGDDFDDEEE